MKRFTKFLYVLAGLVLMGYGFLSYDLLFWGRVPAWLTLQQIVYIFLQVGMWATPVLWNINQFGEEIQMLVKINPLVYIVEGYRSAVYGKEWFWEDFYSTVYFWTITTVPFGIGALISKKLKIHFADIM